MSRTYHTGKKRRSGAPRWRSTTDEEHRGGGNQPATPKGRGGKQSKRRRQANRSKVKRRRGPNKPAKAHQVNTANAIRWASQQLAAAMDAAGDHTPAQMEPSPVAATVGG